MYPVYSHYFDALCVYEFASYTFIVFAVGYYFKVMGYSTHDEKG